MFSSINTVLNTKSIAKTAKSLHSFFEKEAKIKFISFFEGNLKLRIAILSLSPRLETKN